MTDLELLPENYLVARFEANDFNCLERLARCKGELVSVTSTSQEISGIVVDSKFNRDLISGAAELEDDWKAFRILGPLDFELIGVLARLTTTLAKAKIPVFCLSTFLTDYILVKAHHVDSAIEHLRHAEYHVILNL